MERKQGTAVPLDCEDNTLNRLDRFDKLDERLNRSTNILRHQILHRCRQGKDGRIRIHEIRENRQRRCENVDDRLHRLEDILDRFKERQKDFAQQSPEIELDPLISYDGWIVSSESNPIKFPVDTQTCFHRGKPIVDQCFDRETHVGFTAQPRCIGIDQRTCSYLLQEQSIISTRFGNIDHILGMENAFTWSRCIRSGDNLKKTELPGGLTEHVHIERHLHGFCIGLNIETVLEI